ncbi:MAG TPA: carboxypeptidase-like regulatory domain-containing protein, partial [Diaminobutyricibacter sp.]
MHPRSVARASAIAAFVCVLLPLAAGAQATGTIRGSVTDSTGRVIPGALVRLTGARLGAYVDSTGTYRVSSVPVGRYMVRVSKLGYAIDSSTVDVRDGATV